MRVEKSTNLLDIPSFKKDSKIHIKKKNRGKFTEYCGGEVTQKCIDKAKKSGNKTLVKRATFAENSRAWKHADGGEIKLISKHQNGTSNGGIKQDNTRVVKQQKEEAIPIPIVSKQSYLSSDNRTDWQREQSQKQAERDYNQLMEDKATQKGLQNIIGFANFADAASLAFGGLSLLGKGAKWALKRGLTKRNYTSDIIQLLGERKTRNGFTGLRTKDVNPLAEYLEKQGVDVSQLSNNDLRSLMDMRRESVLSSLPQGRSVTTVEIGNGTQKAIDYHLHEGANNIGDLSTIVENGKQHAGSIEKISQNSKNVSRDLYDGSLIYGKDRGYKGLISGEVLQSPEMTKHIWEKYYPKRKIISKNGSHSYNQGRDVVRNGQPFVDSHGEVVDLVKPSSEIPLKSENIFHPSLIENGKLKAPNWNDKNPFKILVPGFILQESINRDSQ